MTSIRPIVSVVVPCFNASDFVGSTIESVRAQTIAEWELIVVDDGSTDGSRTVISRHASEDERVVLLTQSNGGVHVARNAGAVASASTSRYLVFLDADDEIDPTFLETLVDHLEAHPEAGLAYCGYRRVNQHGDLLGSFVPPDRYVPRGFTIRRLPDDEVVTPVEALVSRHEAIPSTCLLRRAVFARTHGWRSAGVIEDKDMVIQMVLLAPVHHIATALVNYRQHDGNRSAHGFYRSLEELHRRWWSDDSLSDEDSKRVRRALAFDRRLSAHFAAGHAREMAQMRCGREAGRQLTAALRRYGSALVMYWRARTPAA